MGALSSAATGVLALAALDAATNSQQSASRVTGLGSLFAKAVAWFVSPTVPGIPDRSKTGS